MQQDTRSDYTQGYRSKDDVDPRQDKMIKLAGMLIEKRDEAVKYRSASGIERLWREDERYFSGELEMGGDRMLDYAKGEGRKQLSRDDQTNARSSASVNIIRGRCEVAEGRFSDILLPTDDKNYGLKTTPKPDLVKQLDDTRTAMQDGVPVLKNGQDPASMAEVAKDLMAKAKEAMEGMENEIDDQLVECDYNSEQRKLIRQSVRLGTGVVKGPNIVKNIKKSWLKEKDEEGNVAYVVDIKEQDQPSSRWVSCWNVYPSPGTTSNVQKSCEYIWEKDEILPRDVKKLIGVDGYFDDQLVAVLQEAPKRTRAAYDGRKEKSEEERGGAYEFWEGYIDVDTEYLEALGCDCSDIEHKATSACVVMINDRVVKAELNVLDTGDIPYDFFPWTIVDEEIPWGIGIPRMLLWLQRILTAAWRAMMDNSGDSARPTVVMSKNLEPAHGIWRLGEIFIAKDDLEDARKAFQVFTIPNNQQHYQAIIELVLRFADLETSLPTIFQGEAQKIPETLGQTNIAVDSSNIGIRHRVKLYDDCITDPHITRYYHWNMQYNNNQDIKGDFDVDTRGTRVLLEKDQQGRSILEVYALKQDQHFERAVNWDKAAEILIKSKRLDILKTDEELKQWDEQQQENGPPPNPQAEVATIRAEGDITKEQMRQESDMTEIEAKAQDAERQRAHDRYVKEMELNVKVLEIHEKTGIEIGKIKAQLAISGEGMNLQRDLSKDKIAGAPQITTPPTEPAGRAEDGHAYEQ